jgi:Holliday junction resolvase RusA-like endonuclease
MRIEFFVKGTPKPAGSKRGFYNPKLKRVMMVDMSGQPGTDWRHDVKCAASDAFKGKPLEGALSLTVAFWMARPKGHFKKSGGLTSGAPLVPTVKPDCTKLLRGLEDALTGITWKDDAQIVIQVVSKHYCDSYVTVPGAQVTIETISATIENTQGIPETGIPVSGIGPNGNQKQNTPPRIEAACGAGLFDDK